MQSTRVYKTLIRMLSIKFYPANPHCNYYLVLFSKNTSLQRYFFRKDKRNSSLSGKDEIFISFDSSPNNNCSETLKIKCLRAKSHTFETGDLTVTTSMNITKPVIKEEEKCSSSEVNVSNLCGLAQNLHQRKTSQSPFLSENSVVISKKM